MRFCSTSSEVVDVMLLINIDKIIDLDEGRRFFFLLFAGKKTIG
jgi:hypothetical protein